MKIKKCLLAIAVTLPLLAGCFGLVAEAHEHSYQHEGPFVINVTPGSHPYTDAEGIYQVCQMEHQTIREYDICSCGDMINVQTRYVVVHHGCGQ